MISKYLTFIFSLLLIGCATNTYNVPFVDSVETVMLTAGMSRSEVLSKMRQKPLYVEYGNQDSGEIFWVYEVRGHEVKSDLLPSGGLYPNKDHNIKRPTTPIHRLRLEFRNNQLYRWQPLMNIPEDEIEEELSNISSDTASSPKDTIYVLVVQEDSKQNNLSSVSKSKVKNNVKKKIPTSFFMEAGLSTIQSSLSVDADIRTQNSPYITNSNYDNNYYNFSCTSCYSKSIIVFNYYLGVENQNGRFGFEVTGSPDSFLGLGLKRELFNITPANINLIFGLGIYNMYQDLWDDDITEVLLDNVDSGDYGYNNLMNEIDNNSEIRSDSYMRLSGIGVGKIGIGKQVNFNNMKFTPRYEMIIGESLFHSLSIGYKIR